jgi:hypothetical protein
MSYHDIDDDMMTVYDGHTWPFLFCVTLLTTLSRRT